MIIGYYGQAFFGGGNYLKLSKENDDSKYKFEYIHSVIPNYISNAEWYIRKCNSLPIPKMKAGKYNAFTIENSSYIDKIFEIIKNTDWNYIAKQEYTSENLDDECWEFYIKYNNLEYLINGYSIHPKEIEKIYDLLIKINDIKEQNKNARN